MNSGYYGVPSVNEAIVANSGYWQSVDTSMPAMTSAHSETYSQMDQIGSTMASYPEFSVVPSVVSAASSPTTCVTTDSSYRHPGSPASKSGSNSRRKALNRLPPSVDPCLIAPLKKRRIDENRLPNTEREKLVQKREKNRDAAAKCRMKKKAISDKLREEHEYYAMTNKTIEEDICDLLKEKESLERLLVEHKCSTMATSQA